MIETIRQAAAFIIISPFVAVAYLLILFTGKKRAVKIIGPPVTAFAKLSVKILVPDVKSAEDFDLFVKKFRSTVKYWKLMYNFSFLTPDKNTVKLHITNCPFCELLKKIGLKELNPYVCQGDWEYAKVCKEKWDFSRENQIGTGDNYCDHTYTRKNMHGEK